MIPVVGGGVGRRVVCLVDGGMMGSSMISSRGRPPIAQNIPVYRSPLHTMHCTSELSLTDMIIPTILCLFATFAQLDSRCPVLYTLMCCNRPARVNVMYNRAVVRCNHLLLPTHKHYLLEATRETPATYERWPHLISKSVTFVASNGSAHLQSSRS